MAAIAATPDDRSRDPRRWVYWVAGMMIAWPPLEAAINIAWLASYMLDNYMLFPLQMFRVQLEEGFRQGRYTVTIVSILSFAIAALLLLLCHRRWRAGLWLGCAVVWVPVIFGARHKFPAIGDFNPLDHASWQWLDILLRSDLFFALGFTAFITAITRPLNLADKPARASSRARLTVPPVWTVIFCCYVLLCLDALRWIYWPEGWRDDPGADPEMREHFAIGCAGIAMIVLCIRRPASLQLAIAFLWLCAASSICMLVFGWEIVPYDVIGLARITQEFGITVLAATAWTAYLQTSSRVAAHFARRDPTIVGYGARLSDF